MNQEKEMQRSIPILLKIKYDELHSKNSSYSLRAFSKKIDVHPAALSEIIRGKRVISKKLATRIASSIVFNELEREEILSAVAQNAATLKELSSRKTVKAVELELDQYYLVSEWYYYAILSLAETADYKHRPKWIAKRLGISLELADSSLKRLCRLGFFERNSKGQFTLKQTALSTSEDILSLALQKRHRQNLLAAEESLSLVPVEKREFTFITMAIDKNKIPLAKLMIREFREKLCSFLENGEKTEVYEFAMQLFPRTLLKGK
jgi:uncharacterized protein (TIGR02147 family)